MKLVVTAHAEAVRRRLQAVYRYTVLLSVTVEVYFDGTNHWLVDGFHRVKAAAQARQETIDVVVHEGGQREALLHAAGANTAHGLRRSNADKRKAALTLLRDEE